MPVLNGPDNFNNQFAVAPDGTIALSTTPFPIGGGTISPGPVIISNNTAAPQASPANTLLQLAAVDGGSPRILIDGYGINGSVTLRRSDGTAAAPTAVLANDALGAIGWIGRGATAYSPSRIGINGVAAQNWTDTAQGTFLNFSTTPNGTVATTEAMRIDHNGNVGIGTTTPQAKLEVNQNAATPALYTGAEVTRFAAADSAACIVGAYSFSGAAGGSAPGVVLHKKRGTGAAPTATQLGDNVGFITWNNFDGTNEHQAATINVTAAENTTSTNAGGILNFYTAGIGQTSVTQRMVIDGNGNVGIGTAGPVNKLVVVSNDNNFRIDTPLANQTATLSWGDGGTSRWGIYTTANALHDLGFYSTAMGATVITIKQATGAIIATAAGHQFGTSGGSLSAPTPINTNLLLYNASPTNWAGIGSDVAGVIYFVNGTTTPTTRMVIDGSGNVGVGSTNTGGFKLDVAGQVRMTTSTIPQLQLTAPAAGDTYLRTVNGNRTYSIGIDGATSDFWIYDGTAGRLDIKIASTNGACFNQSGTWSTVSDASVKENVTPYMRGLDAIVALKPVQFRYTKGTPFAEGDKPSRLLFGLIADDVKPHVPEVVGTTTATIGKKEGVTLSTLEPGNLIYALINAVKELNDQGKEMRAKIAALESATVH